MVRARRNDDRIPIAHQALFLLVEDERAFPCSMRKNWIWKRSAKRSNSEGASGARWRNCPASQRFVTRTHVSTQHGRLDIADLQGLYVQFRDLPNVSISDDQRAPMPWMNWVATVHHGLSADQYAFHPGPGSYFAFLGRISPEKRVDRAIEIATRLGVPLKIAAKVDKVDADYFETWKAPPDVAGRRPRP